MDLVFCVVTSTNLCFYLRKNCGKKNWIRGIMKDWKWELSERYNNSVTRIWNQNNQHCFASQEVADRSRQVDLNVISRPTVVTSHGNLLDMKIIETHPRLPLSLQDHIEWITKAHLRDIFWWWGLAISIKKKKNSSVHPDSGSYLRTSGINGDFVPY